MEAKLDLVFHRTAFNTRSVRVHFYSTLPGMMDVLYVTGVLRRLANTVTQKKIPNASNALPNTYNSLAALV